MRPQKIRPMKKVSSISNTTEERAAMVTVLKERLVRIVVGMDKAKNSFVMMGEKIQLIRITKKMKADIWIALLRLFIVVYPVYTNSLYRTQGCTVSTGKTFLLIDSDSTWSRSNCRYGTYGDTAGASQT